MGSHLPASLPTPGTCEGPCSAIPEFFLPSAFPPHLMVVVLWIPGLLPTGILPSLWLGTTRSLAGQAEMESLPGAASTTLGATGTKSASWSGRKLQNSRWVLDSRSPSCPNPPRHHFTQRILERSWSFYNLEGCSWGLKVQGGEWSIVGR